MGIVQPAVFFALRGGPVKLRMQRNTIAVLLSTLALCLASGRSAWAAPKLIFHGWDTLDATPAEILANADRIATCGSDGFSFRIRTQNARGESIDSCRFMTGARWQWEDVSKFVPELREIAKKPGLEWSMIHFWGMPTTRLALSDDAVWELAAHNLAVLARLAKEGGLKGLVLDAEDYFAAKQYFWDATRDPSWEESEALMRRRGAQFFGGAFEVFPDMDLVSFFFLMQNSYYGNTESDPRMTVRREKDLWPAFVNGLLDVLPPTARISDGDENAYHYEAAKNSFALAASRQMTGLLPLVAPENRAKYRAQNMIGFGFYLDGYVSPVDNSWHVPAVDGSRVTALDVNLRAAMKASDGYVWIYGERHPFVEWSQHPGTTMGYWKGRKTWEEPLPGFRSVLEANKDPLAYVARRRAEMQADGSYSNLAVNIQADTNGNVIAPVEVRMPADWYALSFDMKGYGRASIVWTGEADAVRGRVERASFSAPDVDGVRHGALVARAVPGAIGFQIRLEGNTEKRREVVFSNLELLRVEHIGPGAESRYYHDNP